MCKDNVISNIDCWPINGLEEVAIQAQFWRSVSHDSGCGMVVRPSLFYICVCACFRCTCCWSKFIDSLRCFKTTPKRTIDCLLIFLIAFFSSVKFSSFQTKVSRCLFVHPFTPYMHHITTIYRRAMYVL